jgi:uncharacterized membrane protein
MHELLAVLGWMSLGVAAYVAIWLAGLALRVIATLLDALVADNSGIKHPTMTRRQKVGMTLLIVFVIAEGMLASLLR